MTRATYWADNYLEKRKTAPEALTCLRPGQRVFIGSSCGEPQHLIRVLSGASNQMADIEVVRLLNLETTPLTLIANKTKDQALNIRSIYLGSAQTKAFKSIKRFITPMNLSAVGRLFKSRLLPIDVALIQVSPPDDFGWMSLGISVDITLAAAQSAELVIAQVNPRMPRVLGQSFIHVNDVDVIVEYEEELLTIGALPEMESANTIGQLIKRLIDDGSTLQIGLGTTPQATLMALSEKNDLGIHSQFLTTEMMHLVSRGVITNKQKGFNEGKLVASMAAGTSELYEFLHDNPGIDFYPSDYVNDPGIIARHKRMVTINVVTAMDLTGQVVADALPINHFSGVSGLVDFMRGAVMAPGGKSILLLTATTRDTKKSRIVPMIDDQAIVVPRGDVQYVATEYGTVNLFGKSLQQRALAMISIAHPDFREALFHAAKEKGLLGSDRTLHQSLRGVYPLRLEETIEVGAEMIIIRPAKPVDERRIQEHFYNLDKADVIARFFHEKTRFVREEIEEISQIDYIKDLILIAVKGEVGFGEVVAVGEYLLESEDNNMAEVAFSVSKAYQRKGFGKVLLKKLAEAARENGIAGLVAYMSSQNVGMIKLFRALPYKIKTGVEVDTLRLSCRFDELK